MRVSTGLLIQENRFFIKMHPEKYNLNMGLVQVYTGDGKGKTTAAVGLAVRAAGANLKVGFFQFF